MDLVPDIINWTSISDTIPLENEKHQIAFESDFPIKVNCTRFNETRELAPNFHDYFEIALLYKGAARVIVEDTECQLTQGDMVIFGRNRLHTFRQYGHESADFIWIAFLPSAVYSPGESSSDFEYVRPFFEQEFNFLIPGPSVDSEIPIHLLRIYQLMKLKELHYKIQVKTSLYEILSKIVLYYDKFEASVSIDYNRHQQDIDRIRSVLELVSDHYEENIKLEQAAESAIMSKQYFCRYFKRVTGYTFLEYLMRFRIDKAKEFILEDRQTITEISYKVGFESLGYFYRVFKRFTNLTPQEYHRSRSLS